MGLRPNPVIAGAIYDPEQAPAQRRLHCCHALACVRYAARRNWPGFSCNKCLAFEAITPTDEQADLQGLIELGGEILRPHDLGSEYTPRTTRLDIFRSILRARLKELDLDMKDAYLSYPIPGRPPRWMLRVSRSGIQRSYTLAAPIDDFDPYSDMVVDNLCERLKKWIADVLNGSDTRSQLDPLSPESA